MSGTSGKRLQLRTCFYQIGLQTSLWGIFLVNGGCGRVQTVLDSAIPGQVLPGCIRKQANEEKASKRLAP